jgi:peptide/nickel transport system ATP-binding protein/oligopeptide transport system ATP-binding protein
MSALLEVRDLAIEFPTPAGPVIRPVDGVGFSLDRGKTLALVGESGCGKSLTSLAILGLVPPPGRLAGRSSVTLEGAELTSMPARDLRAIRGRRVAMVFQDPMTSLNPVLTVGRQIGEVAELHLGLGRREARARAADLLREVGIADPAGRLDQYPHQLSGGMRQRVMIAIALAGEPDLLVADEPTTALDVTVQAQILELLDALQRRRGMALLLITHDLGIVAGHADRVAVMYAGRIVEEAPTARLFAAPSHPYTIGLLASVPRIAGPRERLQPIPGTVPSPANWPPGCRFHPRCPEVMERCRHDAPPTMPVGPEHGMRCWLAEAEG